MIERFYDKKGKWWVHEVLHQLEKAQILNFEMPNN